MKSTKAIKYITLYSPLYGITSMNKHINNEHAKALHGYEEQKKMKEESGVDCQKSKKKKNSLLLVQLESLFLHPDPINPQMLDNKISLGI